MGRVNFRGSHDQGLNPNQGSNRSTARKTAKPASRKRQRLLRPGPTADPYQTRRIIRCCGRQRVCNDRNDHDCHKMAAAFGARLLAGVVRKSSTQPCSEQTDKGRDIASRTAKPRPPPLDRAKQALMPMQRKRRQGRALDQGRLLRTRSRICAVSISKPSFTLAERIFKGRRPLI